MKVISADEAAWLIADRDTIVVGGSAGGHAVPEAILEALERRFLAERAPRDITAVHPVGLGDGVSRGANHFAHDGFLKRIVCGTFVNSPLISDMAIEDKIEGYTMPQGVLSQLMREIASGRPGLITKTGLHTFVDPRQSGGRQSRCAPQDLVENITFKGEEYLFFRSFHIDVCILRGTTADEDGNITMEQEPVFLDNLAEAQAAKRCGGRVIVQVKQLARRGSLPPKNVKVPGILVDYVVVEPEQWQTFATKYSPSFAGEFRTPSNDIPKLALTERKIIARRAAMELFPGAICNLGSGISTGIANVAAEEGVLDDVWLTNEQGLIGGAPASGGDAGAARNYAAIVDQPYQFDFYDGGGLDLAFLSFAEIDRSGNVNVSRFGNRIIGPGGFINISQNAKAVIFSGTFAAKGPQAGQAKPKFVEAVEQITYNGSYGASRRQRVIFVTEKAVFRLTERGIELFEIAPGLDLARDILPLMAFEPLVASGLRTMDQRLFEDAPVGLGSLLITRAKPLSSRERDHGHAHAAS